MSEFGRGIYLTPRGGGGIYGWDFDIDESGDIRTTRSGDEELQKDLSFITAVVLGTQIGGRLGPETLNRIDGLVSAIFDGEERIDAVRRLEVFEPDGKPNTVQIQAIVIADNTAQEFVFTEEFN